MVKFWKKEHTTPLWHMWARSYLSRFILMSSDVQKWVGPRLKLVFGAWLETPGQFATMERAADGWAGVPMEVRHRVEKDGACMGQGLLGTGTSPLCLQEVLVEDLEWASEVGCSKCQFSNRGCRTCLFRIIEACYTKGQDVPPLVAELAGGRVTACFRCRC